MRSNEREYLLSPRALLGSLVSFEALLVFYMFAGIYEEDPRFEWMPADPTGLFFVKSVVPGSFIILRNPIYNKGLPVVFVMVCLVTWFSFSLLWSQSRNIRTGKGILDGDVGALGVGRESRDHCAEP